MDMVTILSVFFVFGYTAIALEHKIHVNKAATAVFLSVICWMTVTFFAGAEGHEEVMHHLAEKLGETSQLLIFLIGAMTIVEQVSVHNGFNIVTNLITTKSKKMLLFIIAFITFFLSAVLDNMTTSIVITTLLSKILDNKQDRFYFAGVVIIAANAGGAWTPIGDVTTTMLWIKGQLTTGTIISTLLLPSIVCTILPTLMIAPKISGTFKNNSNASGQDVPYANLFFFLGLGALVFVPIFKSVTGFPPYMGMLFGLGVIWLISELLHSKNNNESHLQINHVLTKIDMPSILFFLGILMTVSSLEVSGVLTKAAAALDATIGNKDIIMTALGLLSAIVDNIPLTAAAQGMYSLVDFPTDSKMWQLLAFSVGTGGSCLIIGSAAGVVVMGLEKIDFMEYAKKIAFPAVVGFFGGIATYLLTYSIFN